MPDWFLRVCVDGSWNVRGRMEDAQIKNLGSKVSLSFIHSFIHLLKTNFERLTCNKHQ